MCPNNQIYIASALTHVPREIFNRYSSFIHDLASDIEGEYICNVKYALKHSDPQLAKLPIETRANACYIRDRKMVEDSSLIIAEASFPSIGLGIELQIAQALSIPIILLSNKSLNPARPIEYLNPDGSRHSLQIGEGYISYMALGLPNVKLIIYHDYETILIVNQLINFNLQKRCEEAKYYTCKTLNFI